MLYVVNMWEGKKKKLFGKSETFPETVFEHTEISVNILLGILSDRKTQRLDKPKKISSKGSCKAFTKRKNVPYGFFN